MVILIDLIMLNNPASKLNVKLNIYITSSFSYEYPPGRVDLCVCVCVSLLLNNTKEKQKLSI